jgi:hypothetical protein
MWTELFRTISNDISNAKPYGHTRKELVNYKKKALNSTLRISYEMMSLV